MQELESERGENRAKRRRVRDRDNGMPERRLLNSSNVASSSPRSEFRRVSRQLAENVPRASIRNVSPLDAAPIKPSSRKQCSRNAVASPWNDDDDVSKKATALRLAGEKRNRIVR